MVIWGYEICRSDIPGYLYPRAYAAISLWSMYKTFGLPFAGGWAEQPGIHMDVIERLETEARKRQAEHGSERRSPNQDNH
jgi:hypothetical protein